MKNCLVPERLAARFTRANSEYLSRANHANFSGHANGWWIALWFYLEQTPSSAGGDMYLWSTHTVNHGVKIYVGNPADKAVVYAYGAVSDRGEQFDGVTCSASQWYFLYCDYDGAALRIQVNDAAVEQVGYTDYVASASALNLGREVSGNHLDGRLQCVMCGHPNILTAAEIAWLYSEVPKWNDGGRPYHGTSTIRKSNQFGNYIYDAGYGDGVGIKAKTTFAASLSEESVGVGPVFRMPEVGALTMTDNNTVTSASGEML